MYLSKLLNIAIEVTVSLSTLFFLEIGRHLFERKETISEKVSYFKLLDNFFLHICRSFLFLILPPRKKKEWNPNINMEKKRKDVKI